MKKLFAALLAMMMLLIPVASFAETTTLENAWQNAERVETVVTIHDLNEDLVKALGGDDTIMAAINDFLNALNLSGYVQGEEIGVSIGLQGKELLWGAMTQQDTVATIASNLLNGTIVVREEEAENLSDNYLRLTMKQSGMTDEEIEKTLEASKNQSVDAAMEAYTTMMTRIQEIYSIDEEELMQQLLSVDWTKCLTVLEGVKIENTEVTEQPEGCTTAALAATVTLTNDQLANFLYEAVKAAMEVPFFSETVVAMRDYMVVADASSNEPLTSEQFDEELNKLIEKIKETKYLAEDATLVLYADENGMPLLCQLDMKLSNGEYEPIPVSATATLEMTEDGAKIVVKCVSLDETTTITINVTETQIDVCAKVEEGELVVDFDVVYSAEATDETKKTNVNAEIMVTEGEDVVSFAVKSATEASMVDGQAVSKQDVTINFMGMDIVMITVESKTCAATESRIGTDAVELGKMNFEEFQTWYTDLQTSLQMLPMQFMMSLPDSVLMLMMNTGN